MQKIKVSTVSSRVENREERKETRDRIDEERKHQIEVFILLLVFLYLFLIYFSIGLHRPDHEGQETYETYWLNTRGYAAAYKQIHSGTTCN